MPQPSAGGETLGPSGPPASPEPPPPPGGGSRPRGAGESRGGQSCSFRALSKVSRNRLSSRALRQRRDCFRSFLENFNYFSGQMWSSCCGFARLAHHCFDVQVTERQLSDRGETRLFVPVAVEGVLSVWQVQPVLHLVLLCCLCRIVALQ